MRRRVPWLFVALLPSAAFIGAFTFLPGMFTLLSSLSNVNLIAGFQHVRFVGLRNYVQLFASGGFWHSVQVTFILSGISVILQFVIGFVVALLLNIRAPGVGAVRVITMMPWVTAPIVVGFMWQWLLAPGKLGLVNALLGALGMPPHNWLTDPGLAMVSVLIANLWRGMPFSAMLELAGLQTLPSVLYEAGRIDGGTPWQLFWRLTVPMMRPTFLVNILMISMWTFNIFDVPFALTGGGPAYATEYLGLYMYRQAFTNFALGYGGAVAAVMFALNAVLTLGYVRIIGGKEALRAQ